MDRGRIRAAVTPITVAEVVTGPLRAGKEALTQRYHQLLTANRGWTLVPIDAELALMAARLRLEYRLKLPDALQLGAALHAGCHAIVSHDRDFSRVSDIPILGL